MLSKDLIRNRYYRDGIEITVEEYAAELEIIKAKAEWTRKIVSGVADIADVPEEWREEIRRRVEEQLTEISEDPELTSEEALDIILGGGNGA